MTTFDPAAVTRALTTRRLGRQIEFHPEVDSTSTVAMRRAREGAPEGLVVVADSQTGGRGRLGRQWVSPPGCNLYCSLILRPALTPPQTPLITLMAGLATADAVSEWVPEDVAIKWPNDVLIRGRKVAGILAEAEIDAERGRVLSVVLGIGVNLNSGAADFPPDVRLIATSVHLATASPVDREVFCGHLLNHLETRYEDLLRDGFAKLLPAWERRDGLRGRSVRVRQGDEVIEGHALGLAADGRLRVETHDGIKEIMAGDVSVIDGYRATGEKTEEP